MSYIEKLLARKEFIHIESSVRWGHALTEEQIDQLAEEFSSTNLGYKRVALRIMREQSGESAVNKALRRVWRLEHANGSIEGLEFVYTLRGNL